MDEGNDFNPKRIFKFLKEIGVLNQTQMTDITLLGSN